MRFSCQVLAVAAVAGGASAALRNAPVNATTGDMYVFAYTYQPEFCYGTTYPGCYDPAAYWTNHFTIHGLWPQYSTGGYPHDCTSEPFDASIPDQIGWETMTTFWPNVKYLETDPNYTEFWEHEWTKHGTCSGLSQYDYFNSAINLIKQLGTPQDFIDNVGGTMSSSDLRNDYGGATETTLTCSGAYINGLYTCWNTVNGFPQEQIVCPADVQAEDTCTSSTINIAAFAGK